VARYWASCALKWIYQFHSKRVYTILTWRGRAPSHLVLTLLPDVSRMRSTLTGNRRVHSACAVVQRKLQYRLDIVRTDHRLCYWAGDYMVKWRLARLLDCDCLGTGLDDGCMSASRGKRVWVELINFIHLRWQMYNEVKMQKKNSQLNNAIISTTKFSQGSMVFAR